MPHLHIETFNSSELPAQMGEVTFSFIATNLDRSGEDLIATHYKNRDFFLVHKKTQTKELLKSDKVTRPSPNFIIKKALLAYAKMANLTIIDSNVDNAPENEHLKTHDALKTIDFFANSFPKNDEIHIEVGFGSARHLLHQAENNPNTLFIGLEIHKPSIEQALKQITIRNLQNLYILDYDARLFLEFVPSNSIGKIYVHFPVPWNKKPHRRVISTSFLDESDRVLKVHGKLELRTDSEEYYRFALETFSSPQKSQFDIRKNQDIAIVSKYEDRWKRMEKNIYDVTYTCQIESEPYNLTGNFDFSIDPINYEHLLNLSHDTIKKQWGFVHIERIFSIEQKDALIRVAMGSFDRPENTYILIRNGQASYFPIPPVRSQSNLKAHTLIDELLHG